MHDDATEAGSSTPPLDTHALDVIERALGVLEANTIGVEGRDEVRAVLDTVRAMREAPEQDVRGCSCGMADYGAPGHDGGPDLDAAPDGICATCRVPEHDVCALDPNCRCCRDTMDRTEDGRR